MSMAEPRRRKKWTLNPRGALWANDETKFGQKLMEKMGWSKGRGLGREEQGIKEHLTVKFKDDSKGIGYKGSDDEWIKHYEGFENVLASLNSQENTTVNSKDNSSDDSAGPSDHNDIGKTSLESSSKASRSRVHYHKFTRGKDLSRCTKDDLGCILGSKRAKQLAKEKVVEDTDDSYIDEVGHMDHSMGVTTIKGCSMQDYFAQKMEALKNRANSQPDTWAEANSQPDTWAEGTQYGSEEEEEDVERPGFGLSCSGDGDGTLDSHDEREEDTEGRKKKKKKKKKKHQDGTEEINSAGTESENCCVGPEMDDVPKKKKKKKKAERIDFNATNGNVCEDNTMKDATIQLHASNEDNIHTDSIVNGNTERRKSKKKQSEAAAAAADTAEEQTISEEHPVVKKKKKRKHREAESEDNSSQHVITEENPERKKKKKKCKTVA